MAKARAIVKRRKSIRNIRKITKTMQMIATAKFQKALRRAVGTKPYTQKVRELVRELAANVGDVQHPLLRRPDETTRTNRVALVVITSNRGLCGAYNGSVLRKSMVFLRQQEAAGNAVDLYVAGKKGIAYFNFQKRPITQRFDQFADMPRFADVDAVAKHFIGEFTTGKLDAVHVAYMNFISAGVQKADVLTLLPLAGVEEVTRLLGQQMAEKEAASAKMGAKGGAAMEVVHKERQLAAMGQATGPRVHDEDARPGIQTTYDFSPSAKEILDELLPLTVKTALFQAFMDATTSENVARMVSMKSATDNADKMVKSLTMQYNRARQSQITTELSEIMGGVEAMKG